MNHRTALITQGLVAIAFVLLSTLAHGDEVPITGVVTAVDATAKTMTVEARAKGKVRQVVIDIRPTTKIVRFAREAPGGAIKEQTATLEDLKPGWTVSVTTKHDGPREVAELVRVVHEK
jgi:hypothetical protein